MAATGTDLQVRLGFTSADDVEPDSERPGLLRARTRPGDLDPNDAYDRRWCAVHDDAAPGATRPQLDEAGFETVDLSTNGALQSALTLVRTADRISPDTGADLRAALTGSHLRLADGRDLRVDHVADDGLLHRRAGPNRLDVNAGRDDSHDSAAGVHADQDVFGTPLAQMMAGAAPRLFRHRTPDATNDDSSVYLLNLWIPIQQVTNPLVFMDRRTLDQRRHQLRYGLPVGGFLAREEDQQINDIWAFLADPGQEWHFRSTMGPSQGYVFDTLGTPHGAGVLPGEDALETLYRLLAGACAALAGGDTGAMGTIVGTLAPALPEFTTDPIRQAHKRMTDLLGELAHVHDPAGWIARAEAAMDAVIRKSVELRLVATSLD